MTCFRAIGIAALVASAALAQQVISARSGLIHYTEGKVFAGDKAVEPKAGEFPELKRGEVLRTEEGRAEMLLTPGVFLRLAENSAVRMISNALESTRLELTQGAASLEVGEVEKNAPIVVNVGQATLEFGKRGLFRIESNPPELFVYDGSAVVVSGDHTVTVKESRRASLDGVINPVKFDKEDGDAFHRWASRRAGYIAMANLVGAKSVLDQNITWNSSGWFYNPYFGSFAYIPFTGRYRSPFGYWFYSPLAVSRVYYHQPVYGAAPGWSGGGGYGGNRAGGYSGPRHADVGGATPGYSPGMSRGSAPSMSPSAGPSAGGAQSAPASVSSGRGSDSSSGRGHTGR